MWSKVSSFSVDVCAQLSFFQLSLFLLTLTSIIFLFECDNKFTLMCEKKHFTDASNVEWKCGKRNDASMHQDHDALLWINDYFIIAWVWFCNEVIWEFHPTLIISYNSYWVHFPIFGQQTKCLASHDPSIINCPTSCPAVFYSGYSCDLSKVVSGFPHAGCGLKGICWQELT